MNIKQLLEKEIMHLETGIGIGDTIMELNYNGNEKFIEIEIEEKQTQIDIEDLDAIIEQLQIFQKVLKTELK